MEWISVKERLPQPLVEAFYIVKHQDEYSISSFTIEDLLSLRAALNVADSFIPNESM